MTSFDEAKRLGEAAHVNFEFKGYDKAYVDQPTFISCLKDEMVFDIAAGARHSVFATHSNFVYSCGSGQKG